MYSQLSHCCLFVCEVLLSLKLCQHVSDTKTNSCTCSVLGDFSHVGLFYSWVIVCCVFFFFLFSPPQSFICKAAFRWCSRLKMVLLLFHATPQHLIGCDEHDADDESNGEGAYQALAHTSLLDLLRRAGTWGQKRRCGREREKNYLRVH